MRVKPHSLLTSIHIGENTKLFRKCYANSNNLLTKVTNAAMYGTHLATVESFTLETLHQRLVSQENVFVMGYPATLEADDKFYVIKKEDFLFKFQFEENLSPPYIGQAEFGHIYAPRTKDTFMQGQIIALDYDASDFTPAHLRFTNPADLMHYLAKNVHPDFEQLSYVSTYSSSAGIYSVDGTMLKDTARFHIYIFIEDVNDIVRFKSVLEGYLLLSNSYWNENNKAGKDVIKLLLDLSVMSQQSLVFETIPKIDKNLFISKPKPLYHQGTVEEFDTSLLKDNFSSEQIERFAKMNHLPVKVTNNLCSVTGIKRDFKTFKYSTIITLSDGSTCTCEDLEARLSGTETISCFSPFRDENNPSCFVSMNSHQGLFLHDMAEKISYFCCEKPLKRYPLNAMLPVDVFAETTMVNNKKVPLPVTSNVKAMLDSYGVTVRYNQMSRTIDTVIPNLNASVDNKEERSLSEILDLCVRSGITITKDRLCGALLSIADENRYHPVKDWILSKDWDGEDRFQRLCDTVQVKPEYEEFKKIVLLKVLQAVVTGAFEEKGNRFEYVFIFTGMQGIGKTTWLSRLLPEGMVYDGCELNLKDKDSIISAVSYAITELGEIDSTFKKSEISSLKAFLSKKKDDIRLPYARANSEFPRRNIFVGSVNSAEFLADETGNRRFWVLHVTALDYLHKIDMQQMFAQVYLMNYLHNDPLYLNKEETALHERLVKNHQIVDPLEEKLVAVFDFQLPASDYMTTTQVLEALCIVADKSNATRMGKLLSTRYHLEFKLNGNVKHYLMPKRFNSFSIPTSSDLAQNQVDVGTLEADFTKSYL
jgi:putative DNA primase/helicase